MCNVAIDRYATATVGTSCCSRTFGEARRAQLVEAALRRAGAPGRARGPIAERLSRRRRPRRLVGRERGGARCARGVARGVVEPARHRRGGASHRGRGSRDRRWPPGPLRGHARRRAGAHVLPHGRSAAPRALRGHARGVRATGRSCCTRASRAFPAATSPKSCAPTRIGDPRVVVALARMRALAEEMSRVARGGRPRRRRRAGGGALARISANCMRRFPRR